MPFPTFRKAPAEPARAAPERAQALAQRVAARAGAQSPEPAAAAPRPPEQPPEPPQARPAGAVHDNRVEVLAQQVADVAARLEAIAAALDGLRQEAAATAQRLKEGDDKFVRLLALLEGVQASDNPFADRGLHEDAPALAAPARGAPDLLEAAHPRSPAVAFARPVPGDARAVPPAWNLEHSVLLLEWADMLLEAVDREALPHLLDWYEGLGWLERPLKERVLSTARGIHANADEPELKALEAPSGRARRAAPAAAQPPPWRQSLEVHLRTLAFVTRLRGLPDESPERLEEAVRKAVAIRAG